MKLVQISGRIFFDPDNKTKKHNKQGGWKRTAMIIINDDTPEYYSWFIKRRYNLELNKPLRGTHITIINDRITSSKDIAKFEDIKKKYHGKIINLEYDVDVRTNAEHWWLKVRCPEGQAIREEADLGEPYFGFHLSIGLVPEEATRRRMDSEYILKCIKRYG